MRSNKVKAIVLSLIVISTMFYLWPKNSKTISLDTKMEEKATKNTKLGGELPFPLYIKPGYSIGLFASGLGKARDLEFTSDGTLLVSDPSTNSVYALSDTNSDGVADEKKVIIKGGNVVHGLSMHGSDLYIALKNQVKLYRWDELKKSAEFIKTLVEYPGEKDHIYRTLVYGPDNKLYISLGSNCNVCFEKDSEAATVIVVNNDGTEKRVFAKGLRNAPFLAFHPDTNQLWATGMARDYLGDHLPPDEINIIQEGKNYGWPLCYGNKIHDTVFDKRKYLKDPCLDTTPPIYEIPAHSAPLGLAFTPPEFTQGSHLLVAFHGSWNSTTPVGYKVVLLSLQGNGVTKSEDFVTGFLKNGEVYGRPVDLAFDNKGDLFISDDKTGNIYIVSR